MGLRVNTNIQSMTAQRHLGVNNGQQKASLEKLASGTRINRAADDAAGLAIAEKMRADIRSINQDIRNANDGISMIQTAEGAMNEVGNILVRFRELSVQAASDTIGDRERGFIEKEVSQLRQEIDRIGASTEYNGRKLMSTEGAGEALDIQIGLTNNAKFDRFQFDTGKIGMSAERLGIGDISVASKGQAQENLQKVDDALKLLSENRAEMGALQNRLQSSISNMQLYNENLAGARSRIYDVDMASETAELTKNNILSTAGTAVLSQANQNSMLALKLIG